MTYTMYMHVHVVILRVLRFSPRGNVAYENSKFSPSFIEALDHNRDVNVLNNDILESKILFCMLQIHLYMYCVASLVVVG